MSTATALQKKQHSFNFSGTIQKPSKVVPVVNPVCVDETIYDVSELFLSVPRDLLLCLLYPCFAVDKTDNKRGYTYEFFDKSGRRTHYMKVFSVNNETGRATMYDKEYLVYAIGIVQDMLDQNIINRKAENRPLVIDVNKMLADIRAENKKVVEIHTDSRKNDAFNKLYDAFDRIMATRIEMYYESGNKTRNVEQTMFIQNFKLELDRSTNKVMLTLELQNWLWRSIMARNPADILTLCNEYWNWTPFQRRLYEIFCVRCGKKSHRKNVAHECEKIDYVELRKLCGIDSDRNFVSQKLKPALGCVKENPGERRSRNTPEKYVLFGKWKFGFNPDALLVLSDEPRKTLKI